MIMFGLLNISFQLFQLIIIILINSASCKKVQGVSGKSQQEAWGLGWSWGAGVGGRCSRCPCLTPLGTPPGPGAHPPHWYPHWWTQPRGGPWPITCTRSILVLHWGFVDLSNIITHLQSAHLNTSNTLWENAILCWHPSLKRSWWVSGHFVMASVDTALDSVSPYASVVRTWGPVSVLEFARRILTS